MMYCQNCGEKLPDDAKFCGNCGTPVNSSNVGSEKSAPVDLDGILENSIDGVKSAAFDFKNEWTTWSSKKKFLSLIVCCCIGWIVISSVMGVLTPDKNAELFDQTNEGKNISLIKESTRGYAFYSSNKTVYNYDLNGVLINIPKDPKGFTVHGKFYDENDDVVKESEMDLDYFTYYTENSDPTTIVGIQTYEFVNVSEIEVKIMNPYGEVVFDENFKFNMNEFDLSRLDDKPETSDENDTGNDNLNAGSSSTNSFADSDDDSSASSSSSSGMTYVASAKSNKFHYPSCSYAKKIKDSNRITFSSRDEAIASGYSPCAVCSP